MRGHIFLAGVSATCSLTAPAFAQAQSAQRYDIDEQDLAAALKDFAAVSGREVVAAAPIVAGRRSVPVRGRFLPEQALTRLLSRSGLTVSVVEGAFILRPLDGDDDAGRREVAAEVVVTGTRIRGAPVASPVITLDQDAFRNAGQSGLGEAIRALPQSFGGGQNPGVGTNVPASSGVDVGGGSSVNLRGLGSDATLTLLNGHRLSYSSSRQSVDISAIPLAAVERIEIIADGASALYGSDAVAGVANVILRRGIDLIETSTRLGSSTDGGNFQQTYSVLGGKTWGSGDIVVAYEHGSNTSILSRDRSYAAMRAPGLTLFPALGRDSVSLNANQRFGEQLSFAIDGFYNNRSTSSVFPLNVAGDLAVSNGRSYGTAETWGVSPTLRLSLADDWRLAALLGYGHDTVDFAAELNYAGVVSSGGAGVYRNVAKSTELNGDGPLFAAPGGTAKLALGAGFRSIEFSSYRGATSFQNLSRSQDSYFGYGELSVPIASPEQGIRFAHRLNLSGAARYENYPGVGDVATPKIGLVYEPTRDLGLKASWGRSFRAPTLLQQFAPNSVNLVRATSVGGVGLPATATAILLQGGNASLQPEKARTWSVTADLHPQAIPGAAFVVSYFSTRYRDRIVTPIGSTAVALSNPIYAALVTRSPSDATKAAVIAGAGTFVNAAGAPYAAANVVAVINNSSVNAGRQSLHGVDGLLSYRAQLGGDGGSLAGSVNAAYLFSEQQLTADQPVIPLAGTVFNPPHFRARGNVAWSTADVTVAGSINYTGSTEDRRFTPVVELQAIATADLTIRLRTDDRWGPLRRLELAASILNMFNARPSNIRTTLFTDTPYDSTNYSPVGRFISFAVTKSW